jgi:hypothetical protein
VRRLPAPLAVLVAVLAAAPAQAATLHITPSGTGTGCTLTSPCDTLRDAYNVAQPGDTIQLAPGTYPSQGTFSDPAMSGTNQVTVLGGQGVVVRQIVNRASNVTFDGLDLDAGGAKTSGAVFETYGSNVTFKNGRIGNVTDEKGVLSGATPNVVFDNVHFHDVYVTSGAVHNECVYSQTPNITIKNSRFTNCATMDVFFTRGAHFGQPAYGGFKLLNNFFGKTFKPGGAAHSYTVAWTSALGQIRDAEIRGNTFELPVNNGGMSAISSVASCNIGRIGIPGLIHEPCIPLHRAASLIRSARLTPQVVCRRGKRSCPRVALLQVMVSEPVRLIVRVEKPRDRRRPRRVRSFARSVMKRTKIRIRSSRLRTGRYRVVVVARAAGGRPARIVLGLRVR